MCVLACVWFTEGSEGSDEAAAGFLRILCLREFTETQTYRESLSVCHRDVNHRAQAGARGELLQQGQVDWSFLSPAVGGGPCSRTQMSDQSQRCVQGVGGAPYRESAAQGSAPPYSSATSLPQPHIYPPAQAGSGPSSFGRLRESPLPTLILGFSI